MKLFHRQGTSHNVTIMSHSQGEAFLAASDAVAIN